MLLICAARTLIADFLSSKGVQILLELLLSLGKIRVSGKELSSDIGI